MGEEGYCMVSKHRSQEAFSTPFGADTEVALIALTGEDIT